MIDLTKDIIGVKLRDLRRKTGKSQEDLARVLDIPRVSVSQIENGQRDINSIELAKIAEFFGVSTDYLLLSKEDTQELEKEIDTEKAEERISVPKLKTGKFKEVLIYILEKTAGKLNVGQTVLYKLLYFSDFNYYERFEEQLTGAKYQKNLHGPTPIAFKKIIDEMIDKEIKIDCNDYFGRKQLRYIALRKADLRKINGAEKEIIDDVINRLGDMNATQISDYSHEDVPWKVTKDSEIIDYETVFYRGPQYSVREYKEL